MEGLEIHHPRWDIVCWLYGWGVWWKLRRYFRSWLIVNKTVKETTVKMICENTRSTPSEQRSRLAGAWHSFCQFSLKVPFPTVLCVSQSIWKQTRFFCWPWLGIRKVSQHSAFPHAIPQPLRQNCPLTCQWWAVLLGFSSVISNHSHFLLLGGEVWPFPANQSCFSVKVVHCKPTVKQKGAFGGSFFLVCFKVV